MDKGARRGCLGGCDISKPDDLMCSKADGRSVSDMLGVKSCLGDIQVEFQEIWKSEI